MLVSRQSIARQTPSTTGYVCLSCRLRTKQQRRRLHDGADYWETASMAGNAVSHGNIGDGTTRSATDSSPISKYDVQLVRTYSKYEAGYAPPSAQPVRKHSFRDTEKRRIAIRQGGNRLFPQSSTSIQDEGRHAPLRAAAEQPEIPRKVHTAQKMRIVKHEVGHRHEAQFDQSGKRIEIDENPRLTRESARDLHDRSVSALQTQRHVGSKVDPSFQWRGVRLQSPTKPTRRQFHTGRQLSTSNRPFIEAERHSRAKPHLDAAQEDFDISEDMMWNTDYAERGSKVVAPRNEFSHANKLSLRRRKAKWQQCSAATRYTYTHSTIVRTVVDDMHISVPRSGILHRRLKSEDEGRSSQLEVSNFCTPSRRLREVERQKFHNNDQLNEELPFSVVRAVRYKTPTLRSQWKHDGSETFREHDAPKKISSTKRHRVRPFLSKKGKTPELQAVYDTSKYERRFLYTKVYDEEKKFLEKLHSAVDRHLSISERVTSDQGLKEVVAQEVDPSDDLQYSQLDHEVDQFVGNSDNPAEAAEPASGFPTTTRMNDHSPNEQGILLRLNAGIREATNTGTSFQYSPFVPGAPGDRGTMVPTANGRFDVRATSSIETTPLLCLDKATEEALDFLEEAADRAAGAKISQHMQDVGCETQPHLPCSSQRTGLSGGFAWQRTNPALVMPNLSAAKLFARMYHTSRTLTQHASVAVQQSIEHDPPTVLNVQKRTGIRAQLQQWQDLHGHEDPMPDITPQDDILSMDSPANSFTRLSDEATAVRQAQYDDEEDTEAFSRFANAGKEGFDGDTREDARFIQMGDLVELDLQSGEREGLLAVYVRPVGNDHIFGQFFTMRGTYVHVPMKCVQYSIPDWISPKMIEPLLQHLPDLKSIADARDLNARAYMEDLSVPRDVAAPIVSKLTGFHNDSNEIYRKNASSLDKAHSILAHESDLRYGSLVSAATTLLNLPSDKLPLTALFTVRKALTNAGFAFNMDRRSHRLTGYMQIRSKDQVKMVETVRSWLRQWQDNVAASASMDERQARLLRDRAPRGAQNVYGFIEKAKAIVMQNRQTREPLDVSRGNVSPSKARFPITETSDCVRTTTDTQLTNQDAEIVRFLEAYACANTFEAHPRLMSLPPLLMHATGLYPSDAVYSKQMAFIFLQELGTIMPYENRIRFDQHLLLPSSQHSRPLQNLMSSLIAMKHQHNKFQDSMAGLRHDWKDLPVYCIDSADAHEIDDGISIEPAGPGEDGKEQHWVHIHIANPTAFFSRDHPMAKMARHMGETIYMPERAYMMLPSWSTQKYFSLAQDRPCLTFSAKLNSEGHTVEKKITPGTVRNVLRLTADEVNQVLGISDSFSEKFPELVLTVGGDPPPGRARKSQVEKITDKETHQLRALQGLAEKRAGLRRAAGGIFFDQHKPDVKVWQSWKGPGLAWDHPYRKGRRTVEGDPVIQYRTRGLVNWFQPNTSVADILVREMMLLACELSASWCAERQIPVIYRGSVLKPGTPDPKRYHQEVLVPVIKPDGSMPMHLGRQYINMAGSTILRTKPLWHNFLGMSHYSKATSPLRRYGDMILHWQIEAALRHEAETGKSLITEDENVDRSFLPFSSAVLEVIMLGLQPREQIIMRSKTYAENFWASMMLARKHYHQDGGALPFYDGRGNGEKPLRMYLQNPPLPGTSVHTGMLIDLNMACNMHNPEKFGMPEARLGDVWECVLDLVVVFTRQQVVRPVRLVGREGAGFL